MRIAVIGLGYVGTVSSACLADAGHEVIGVDRHRSIVDHINSGRSPIVEAGLGEIIARVTEAGRLQAVTDAEVAVASSEITFVCVGTPSGHDGSLELTYVREAAVEIGRGLAGTSSPHVVVVRSTVLPGTTRDEVIPRLEAASGHRLGEDLAVLYCPEFLREGSAVADYFSPPQIVVGGSGWGVQVVRRSLVGIDSPFVETTIEVAEMVKYASNVFHAMKVGFANEVGSVSKALGVDGRKVMEIFCRDQRLNISKAYLRPGPPFGGACLPKDTRALVSKAREVGVETPLLGSVLESNQSHVQRCLELIEGARGRKLGILGFSFKPGTADPRESVVVRLVAELSGKGYEIKIYDPFVTEAVRTAAVRDLISAHPGYEYVCHHADEILDHAETLVVANSVGEYRDLIQRRRPGTAIVDLCDLLSATEAANVADYSGICW